MKTKTILAPTVLSALLGALACSEPTSPPAESGLRADVAPAATPSYTISDLGTLGGASANARAINNAGQVVGASVTASGDTHAFLWTATDGLKDLGTLGGTVSQAFGINSLGHVVGTSALASGERRPFFWTPAGGMQDLGTFGGGFGQALGINDLDQVVGRSNLPDGSIHAFRWTAESGIVDLGTLTGPDGFSDASAVNARGQIVGQSTANVTDPNAGGLTINAALWDDSGIHDLGTLPGDLGSRAFGINNVGQIVGLSVSFALQSRAVLWTPNE